MIITSLFFKLKKVLHTSDFIWVVHYRMLCFLALFELPYWADFAGSKNGGDTLGHKNASFQHATAQTLSGAPGPYSSHSAPPGGQTTEACVLYMGGKKPQKQTKKA